MFRIGESTSMGSRVSKGILLVATEHGNKDEDDEHFTKHDLLENENKFEYISQKKKIVTKFLSSWMIDFLQLFIYI